MTLTVIDNPVRSGEFRLISVSVSGIQHHGWAGQTEDLVLGAEVEFLPEPTNTYDEYAVSIWVSGVKLGYFPNSQQMSLGKLLFFRMLSGGSQNLFRGAVRAVGKHEVQVDIFMRVEETK